MNDMQMGPPASGDVLGVVVVVLGLMSTLLAFVIAIRATMCPSESEADHPKRSILSEDR